MKTIIKPIIIISIIVVGFISLLTECRKDTSCTAVITVRKRSDTAIVVPNARIRMYQGNVNIQGITDMNGQFTHTFTLPAILNDSAKLFKRDSSTVDSLSGSAVIQLIVGGTAYRTVFVQ
jgi:hypothetical protein